jgi:hypothetical protein
MDDSELEAKASTQEDRPNFPVMICDPRFGELYGGISGLPVTFLIERTVKIRSLMEGETNLALMESRLNSLLPSRILDEEIKRSKWQ